MEPTRLQGTMSTLDWFDIAPDGILLEAARQQRTKRTCALLRRSDKARLPGHMPSLPAVFLPFASGYLISYVFRTRLGLPGFAAELVSMGVEV